MISRRVVILILLLALIASAGKADFDVHGLIRYRQSFEGNFDLDNSSKKDQSNDFLDLRSYISCRVQDGSFSGMLGIDLAGDDFNDGVLLGNNNPATQRPMEVAIRHLYIQYNRSNVLVRVGRQPSSVGHGIVAHIVRDMAVAKLTPKSPISFTGIWVKGGEGLDENGISNNDPETGSDNDLDMYAVAVNYAVKKDWINSLVLWAGRQFDSTADSHFPEKLYIDALAKGKLNGLNYSAEAAYFGGQTPSVNNQPRLDNRGYLCYFQGDYDFKGKVQLGVAFGRGSGDNDPNDSKQRNFQNLFMDETGFLYTHLFADDILGYKGANSDLGRGSGFANITFLQAKGSLYPLSKIPSLNIGGSLTHLRSTVPQRIGSGVLGNRPTNSLDLTHDTGWEIDLNAEYSNGPFRYSLRAAYFKPGDIFGLDAFSAKKIESSFTFEF